MFRSLVFVLAGGPLALAQEWEARFRSNDGATRREAYEELQRLGGEERDRVIQVLVDVQLKRREKFQREWKRLHDAYLGYGKRGEKGMLEYFGPWLRARESAVEIIFDERRYPVPPNRRASGPMQGYDLVRPRLDATLQRFQPIGKLARQASSTALRGGLTRSLDGLKAEAAVLREADGVLAKVRKGWRQTEIGSFDFLEAMARIGEEDFLQAVRIYERGQLTRAQKIIFFLIYAHIIENYNLHRIRSGMSDAAKQAVSKLNEYRMALGILPYEHDANLTKAIQGHVSDIASGRTEYGHVSSVPGKRTAADRARRAGWNGSVSENLAMMPPMRSVEAWFWDGGHGRNNVSPLADKIGFASAGGVSGFNNGSGGACVLPRFNPPFTYGKWTDRKRAGSVRAPSKPGTKKKRRTPFGKGGR